jgi:hypothetical protein
MITGVLESLVVFFSCINFFTAELVLKIFGEFAPIPHKCPRKPSPLQNDPLGRPRVGNPYPGRQTRQRSPEFHSLWLYAPLAAIRPPILARRTKTDLFCQHVESKDVNK